MDEIIGKVRNGYKIGNHNITILKSRIYKFAIRSLMTYTAETRPDTTQTKKLLETSEMRILRKITGKTL